MGDTERICTIGFGKANTRKIRVYDARNVSLLLGTLSFGTSPSVLVPIYDVDTGFLDLAGRGDTFIQFYEINESHVPTLVNRYNGSHQAQQDIVILPKSRCY